ncbi:MAG: alpha/beta fold hydrolase [Rhodospirillaceae bacterium]
MTSRFVLVHGAYHGAWYWERFTPLLNAAGAAVSAPDLPGHGDDMTPSADLTLPLYADRVADAVRAMDGPVTLAGHSMAGAVIAEVAERVPDLLTRLVYLTAYMPGTGETIADWAKQDTATKAIGQRIDYEGAACLTMDRAAAHEAFYREATETDMDWIFPKLRPEPLAIFRHALSLTPENFGSVPRDYISCRGDLAITAALQDAMLSALPARRVWRMDCSHSPQLVAAAELVDILMEGEAG